MDGMTKINLPDGVVEAARQAFLKACNEEREPIERALIGALQWALDNNFAMGAVVAIAGDSWMAATWPPDHDSAQPALIIKLEDNHG